MDQGTLKFTSLMEAGKELVHTPISGLPDDLAILCLVKVPKSYHHILKCICKRWKLLLNSEEWLFHLRTSNRNEPWIYVVCKDTVGTCLYVVDPSEKSWKLIKKLPPSCQEDNRIFFVAVDKNLYILGCEGSPKVYLYDVSTDSFKETCERPSSRLPFACETVNGKLYVISSESHRGRRHTAELHCEIFDPNVNQWTTWCSNFVERVDSYSFDRSFSHNGKIHLRFSGYIGTPARELILEPATSSNWERVVGNMSEGWRGYIAVVNGTLYMLDGIDHIIKTWNEELQEWVNLHKLSQLLRLIRPCRLAAAGTSIYVISATLQTLVIDVINLGNAPVLFTGCFVEGHDDLRVLCCPAVSY